MIAGGALGYFGFPLPMVEQAIGLSVIVMSLMIASGVELPTFPSMALVALFALFHGHAHGAEGAHANAFLPFAFGFVIATAALHLIGIGLGLGLERLNAQTSRRLQIAAGATGALVGVAILAGLG